MTRIVALALALAMTGKTCQTPDPAPVPLPVPDAGDECGASANDACGLAGATLCRLQCRDEDGVPLWRTPAGRPFADVCRVALVDGRDWHPTCLARITDCSQVEAAFRAKGGAACER